jgi:hypothetical protein
MKGVLVDFQAGIDQLMVFLERNLLEQEFISLLNEAGRRQALQAREIELLDALVKAATNTKQYIYIVSIISIYGLLERLVDGVVSKYVMVLKGYSTSYSKLPEIIKKNHFQYSIALTEALLRYKLRSDDSPEKVISNLNSCLSGQDEYTLNGAAFALHRGNINIDKISEMLSGIGVVNHLRRILRAQASSGLHAAGAAELGGGAGRSDEEVRKIFEPIDELVEKRNQVSHGVVEVDDLESIDLLIGRCNFVRAYGKALCEVLEQETLKYVVEVGAAHKLGVPIAIFDNKIICFEDSCAISVGDKIFALTDEAVEPVRLGSIVSLQVDKVEILKLNVEGPTKFAAAVDFHANGGYCYYWMSKDMS